MLFGDADVEIAFGKALREFDQAAAFAHGGGDGGQAGISFCLVAQPAAEDLGVAGFFRLLFGCLGIGIGV